VETWYAPASLPTGAWISAGALVLALWAGAKVGRRPKGERSA